MPQLLALINEIKKVPRGAYKTIVYKSTSGILKKGKTEGLEKIVSMQVAFGVNYSNIASVKQERELNGTTNDVHTLPSGTWRDSGYLIENDKGELFVRVRRAKATTKEHVEYFLKGERFDDIQWLKDNKYISDKETKVSLIKNINIENIIKLKQRMND